MDAAPRHQCLIYAGPPSKQLPALGSVIMDKLKSGSRCLYLNSPPMVAGLRSYLATAGLDVASEVQKGALVLSSDQGHLRNCGFDVESMLDMLKNAIEQAAKDG